MTEASKITLRAIKSANIIMSISELFKVSLKEATDIFYTSTFSGLIEEGVADLQCRSDKYLATIIWEEYLESTK